MSRDSLILYLGVVFTFLVWGLVMLNESAEKKASIDPFKDSTYFKGLIDHSAKIFVGGLVNDFISIHDLVQCYKRDQSNPSTYLVSICPNPECGLEQSISARFCISCGTCIKR